MSPRSLTDPLLRETPVVRADQTVAEAVQTVLDSDLPAVPVVENEKLLGIFGEREFIGALFPGYLKELGYAGFVPRSLDKSLEKRADCAADLVGEHMNSEHIDVGEDFSDTQIAEVFLHHRVLIVPIVDDGVVTGIVTRHDFFHALARRFLDSLVS